MDRERESSVRPPEQVPARLEHQVLISRGSWADAVTAFIREAIRRDEPVSVGLPAAGIRLLRERLGDEPLVDYFDMLPLGRNPARILGAMLDFADIHAGRPVRYVSQPQWAGRSAAEDGEVARHEALVNLAFARISARVLCLYDDPGTAAGCCAEQTHPSLLAGGRAQPSRWFAGPGRVPAACHRPLSPPPPGAGGLIYRTDLRAVRRAVTRCAQAAGLAGGRLTDLVIAVSELAANTLRHAGGTGTLWVWATPDEVICQVSDAGHITDPLAGRHRPPPGEPGQGLWVVNQVCDLVELRSGPAGTTVRLRMRLADS
jgi:anti-sigma regulatory factor (Ser/Thr protein kinase)